MVAKAKGPAEVAASMPSRCSNNPSQKDIILNVGSYSAGCAESATRPSRMRGC